jgi:hypothetical protein
MIKPAVKLIQANAITGAVERYVKKFFMVSKSMSKLVILNSKNVSLELRLSLIL